jgi:ubiquinone biosynthesis protein
MSTARQRQRVGEAHRRERRARREWVARHLAALGLARETWRRPWPPLRFPRAVAAPEVAGSAAPGGLPGRQGFPGSTATGGPAALRLAAALPELGPVFCAFGRYLAGRPDLLPEDVCQALAEVPVDRPPLPLERVRELLARELTQRPAQAPARGITLEPEPSASTLVYQEHHGRLAAGDRTDPGDPGDPRDRGDPGERVVVRLVRPDLEAELACDLELLPLLGPALAAASGDPRERPSWLAATVDDFAGATAVAADFSRLTAALAALDQDGAASGLAVGASRALPELSSQQIVTLEDLPGTTLADLFREHPEPPWEAAELAARWCRAWLRQACFGQVLPVDFEAADVRLLPDGRLIWTGGTFVALPPAAKSNLWDYLVAAAADDPDRAVAALVRELDGGPADGGSALHHRLRQLVPFRDGGWAAKDDLAGYLFLHWRCAAETGYRPRPPLVAFYRGLARLAAVARRLAPRRDALREGLEAARVTAGMGELARLLDREQIQQVLGSYATVLLAMPQRIDDLLSLAAAGRVNVKVEVIERSADRRRRDWTATSLAVLMAMAAVILLAHHLSSASGLGPWPERIAAAMLGVLGAFLLRSGGRGGRGGRLGAAGGGDREP